ncbi:sugar ABC transporter permease [Fusibacter sp. A1]|nr:MULTISPECIES: sugar ABC transporter permease [unclassified Fusibacter]MCK8061216.1 sugar ABC transporter permease [Fusibacter sp. A2]NPE23440.1 sugar ABC transporter permease [Fusibacter sp. A1]RXV59219.1 sugar ABC transporter permease [Fusibacter sp. A1]
MMIKRLKSSLSAYTFMSVHLIGFAIFFVIPFFSMVLYSFRKGFFDSSFAGFTNYIKIFNNIPFQLALKNNAIFMLVAIPLIVMFSFVIGFLLYELKVPRWIKLAFILPIFIPSGAVIGFYRSFFTDMLESEQVMIALILIFIWKNLGYNLIIYLATFGSMHRDIMDYAKVDGANFMQTIYHVVWPMTIPSTFFVVIVSIVNSFKVFKDIYLLQGNYPNQAIYMVQNFMNNKFRDLQVEQLSAAAVVFTCFLFAGVLLFLTIERRYLRKVSRD